MKTIDEFKNKIIQGDCLDVMPEIPDKSIDMILTSPPYNVDLGNNKYHKIPYDLYNDNKEHQEYIGWLKQIFELAYKKLKSGGRVCINIGDGKNGSIPTHSDIINFMVEIGYIPMATIIWDKNQVANRSAWGSFRSPSFPSFPSQFEYIMVFLQGK
jgi:site-specific DNA-methyltransferase (adenine-specific)